MLNSLGSGVQKSSDKWKKAWADWKTKTKKKYLSLKLQASGTGGGPSSRTALTALEERVVAVIGVSAVLGQAGIQEQGFNKISSEPVFQTGNVLDIEFKDHSQNRTSVTPAMPPSPPPPSPPPRTPPARNNRGQASASPRPTPMTPRRASLRARRNRGLTPFERAADRFAAIEQRRLEYDEARDKRIHEQEMERLRLEAERIEVTREHNLLLHQLSLLGQRLIDVITQQRLN